VVKANQPALHHAIAELCNTVAPLHTIQTTDKKRRSRDETRMVEVFAPGNSLADTAWDGHVSAVIRVNRDVLTRSAITGLWRSNSETALFVGEVVLPAAQCAKAIRDHWSTETRSHYVRDGSFAEDASRIRCHPGILARLRSFAANISRFNGVRNVADGRHRIASGGISAILDMPVLY
jgi:predicted transposase YbfD/YdcC